MTLPAISTCCIRICSLAESAKLTCVSAQPLSLFIYNPAQGRFAVDYQSHVKGCGIEVFEAEPVIGRKEEIEFDSLEAELEYLEKELREAREAQSKELPGMRRGFLNSNTPRGPEVMFFIQSIPHVLSLIAVALMCLFVAGRAALVHRARGCNTHASERLLVALGSI
eukprot:gnl/TRDRNA2_/TRDRNA2_177721_c2_seq12.p1 gnl/TRDRNA2_/TRDRNA2_177721_c2~~gnl/TRDRNA2_/TRDRNA2_177721_c2_seq12.p1  ORF type:complete len:167 (+),score=20.76 gnl/TRDRNA2_/TRDRNA2_177721_c2_seq12:413-913(+)